MIDDAIQWKEELLKIADRLEAKTKQKRWTDRTGYLIERDFIVGAHAMRKLIDSYTVSDELRERQFPVRRYALMDTPPEPVCPEDIPDDIPDDILDDIVDRYDFENGRRRALSVADLCHEIVNSFAFAFCCGETADLFDGIYVSSDRQKRKYIYLILASDFIAVCSDIGSEDVPGSESGI